MARARSFANVTAFRAVSNPAWCRIFREISCFSPLNIGTLFRCCVLGQLTIIIIMPGHYKHKHHLNCMRACFYPMCGPLLPNLAHFSPRGTGMIASSSNSCPHPGRVIRDMFRQLYAVWHGTKALVYSNPRETAASSYLAIIFGWIASGILWFLHSTAVLI